jgi:hypothetical protein
MLAHSNTTNIQIKFEIANYFQSFFSDSKGIIGLYFWLLLFKPFHFINVKIQKKDESKKRYSNLQGRDSVQCVTTQKSFLPIGIFYNIT